MLTLLRHLDTDSSPLDALAVLGVLVQQLLPIKTLQAAFAEIRFNFYFVVVREQTT